MSRFRIELATESDEAQLRRRMAEDCMPGRVAISFRREPNYFLACDVLSEACQVVKGTDTQTNKIIGLGARLTLNAYISGKPTRIGLLSDLRLQQEFRRGTLIARGYKFFKQLHSADPVPFYGTLIYEGNHLAEQNLLQGRGGLPVYSRIGRIVTHAILLDMPRRLAKAANLEIARGRAGDMDEVFAFMAQYFATKQFAPVLETKHLGTPRLRGLRAEDFYIVRSGGKIVASIAAWDQHEFRQTHVEAYSGPLRYVRPFYNLATHVSPFKPLPGPGEIMPYFYLAFPAVQNDNPEILSPLLDFIYADRRAGPWNYAILGIEENSPLQLAAERFRSIKTAANYHCVHYPEDRVDIDRLRQQPLHVELACL